MNLSSAKLVTIVAEAVLTERLGDLLRACGASGHTLTAATGEGSRGLRSTTVVDGENVRFEALVSEAVAARLLDALVRDYFPHYAVIAWVTDVGVVRGDKFGVPIP